MRALKSYGALLSAVALIALAPAVTASVFYKMDVVAATPVGSFVAFGSGPSINDKGKVAFLAKTANSPTGPSTVMVWTPTGGTTDLATNLYSPNRHFGENLKINNNDEIATWNRLLPLGLYEVRVFRAATPNDTSIAVRGLVGGTPYEILYQNPTMNNNRVLEDRLAGLTGNKDGVCDPGEVCLSQIAFNAVRQVPARFLGTVVQTPTNAFDNGVQNEFGMNTSQSRPAMADDGRIVIRGLGPTDPINLFNYSLGAPTAIANTAMGFTALGAAPGITPDGKIVAFAANRGQGDGIFLSMLMPSGQRRLVRIIGENQTVQKAELGYSATNGKLFFSTLALDSRVGIAYTPGRTGAADGAIVVTFVGTPNGPSRTNTGTGKPYVHSANKGLWTVRIELDAVRMEDACDVRAPGVTGNVFTLGGDDQIQVVNGVPFIDSGANKICESNNNHDVEVLLARAGPIPVVQVGDRILAHTVADIAVYDPVAPAKYDDNGAARTARLGDHRVAFWADVGGGNHLIVRGEHLDSDQDGLMDHWETTGLDLDGTGNIDLNLAAMGATPFQRDFFVQIDFAADRARPLNVGEKHRPIPGTIRRLAQFYAGAPAMPNGVVAGVRLHVDAGTGLDRAGQNLSRNMGTGPLRGGNLVHPQPIDIIHYGLPGSVSIPGVTAVDFDTIKQNALRSSHRGAREFVFTHVVWADFHHALPDNITPFTSTASSGDSWNLYDNAWNHTGQNGNAVLITGGTGAGQVRSIGNGGNGFLTVNDAWSVPPDGSSTYIFLDGSGGESQPGDRYDGAFSPGKNFSLTLGGFGFDATGREQGNFTDQWKTLAHEIGHNQTLMHGGSNHVNRKANYVSLMNYAYELCTTGVGTDAQGNPLPGAASCPVDSYAGPSDAVRDDWGTLDFASALNPSRTGQAFSVARDPNTMPFNPVEHARTINDILIQHGPRDNRAPVATINAPLTGTTIAQGNGLAVSFTATDNVGVVRAEVLFDVNGNGEIEEPAEVFAATAGGGGTFTANVPAVGGPSGTRSLTVYAFDAVGNPGTAYVRINVGSVAPVNVPSVTGSAEEAARTALLAAQLEVGAITRQQSGSVAAGAVISQNPVAGQSRPPGTAVALVISLGTSGTLVPNVKGLTQGAAGSAITGAGLTVGTVTPITGSPYLPGTVIGQSPLGGDIAVGGSAVLLLVAASANVTVPSVVNLTQSAATSAITGVGLVLGAITQATSPSVPAGNVISQNPAAGASVAPGSAVALLISLGPQCSTFGDVPASSSFCANVDWLKNRAITLGCTSTSVYCPADPVTRLAMAAFMNRLGTALTANAVTQEAAPGSVVAGAGNVVCQTADTAITGFPRRAYVDAVFAATAAGVTEFGADVVASLDGGATWSNLTTQLSRATTKANRWTNVRALGERDLDVGQSVRFGIRVTRGSLAGTATLTDSRCHLRALFGNRNGTSVPYDPLP